MTPNEHCPSLAKILGLSDLYLKREDLHPYGSHKGRSIPTMIDHYYKNGDRHFVISSSGNAALAAALHIQKLNDQKNHAEISKKQDTGHNSEMINLDIFVGKNISDHKLQKLRDLAANSAEHIKVVIKDRPLQSLMQATEEGLRSLRQSVDDTALLGYESLAEELADIEGAGAVFIGTSSGTTAQALAQYFLHKKLPIQVHIVQTSSCHPLSDQFETYEGPNEKSIADAIVGITTPRSVPLIPLIKESGGRGWIANNEEIVAAQELVKKYANIDISTNSALSIVGAMQAVFSNWEIDGSVICLICGE